MNPESSRTLICSVVYADLVGYSRVPVGAQLAGKRHFNELLAGIMRDIDAMDVVIVDTGDGAAVSCLGDPEDALYVGMRLREGIATQNPTELRAIRIGINLGPVKLMPDVNARRNLVGDGINSAQRVMSFARPGQILASRSYREAIAHISRELAELFTYQGAHADKHVREHEVYAVAESPAAIEALRRGVESRAIPAPARAPRAMIAEDEPVLREELRDLLAQIWPELEVVALAPDGIAAMREFERLRPDVVFLDIQMPGMSGLEVARALDRRSHVVFATAFDQHAVRAFDEGAIDYLLKPYSAARLMETCRRIRARLDAQPASVHRVIERLGA